MIGLIEKMLDVIWQNVQNFFNILFFINVLLFTTNN